MSRCALTERFLILNFRELGVVKVPREAVKDTNDTNNSKFQHSTMNRTQVF